MMQLDHIYMDRNLTILVMDKLKPLFPNIEGNSLTLKTPLTWIWHKFQLIQT